MNDKYLHFNIEDLLSDDAFINWVQTGSKDTSWRAWIEKNPAIGNKIDQAKVVATSIKFNEIATNKQRKELLWNRIEQSTSAKQVELPRSNNRFLVGIAIAASLALLMVLRQGFFNSRTAIATQDQAQIVTLPADSKVDLAKQSTLKYEEKEWAVKRSMNLTGTATFDVTKGQPFVVKTQQGQIRVLGTKFTVEDNGEDFKVHVDHGRVEVTYGRKKEILTKGQKYIANPTIDEVVKQTNNPEKREYYEFVNISTEDLVGVLIKMYDIEIKTDRVINKLKERHTVNLSNQDVMSVGLHQVFWTANINYLVNDKTIELFERKE